ncbi:MAG: hypothetical protein P8X63_03030 [Desulfuromonadaceae bacterium]
MQKLVALPVMALLLTCFLLGCATNGGVTRCKCPACGYEFYSNDQ